ncbi:lysoplasmalogenase family protein [Spirochaeta cellobiosiphila]|uniref:lysoplasmalogenase family protein n=1 Tax=Spirochaeta cellobiosiphila TaxID=504483 RepID=UPI00041796CF|nr:lysoplasmalogenase family protein [Spirochaeta cellobiosiphila]
MDKFVLLSLSALLYLLGAVCNHKKSLFEVLFKVLATAIIVFLLGTNLSPSIQAVFIGAVFALLGDAVLAVNNHVEDDTTPSLVLMGIGILLFLIGYLCYGITFLARGEEVIFSLVFLIGMTFLTFACYRQFKLLDKVTRVPVILYCLQGILLITAAFRLLLSSPSLSTALIFVGSAGLYISDMIIGFNLFCKKLDKGEIGIMATYALGQIAITWGVINGFS